MKKTTDRKLRLIRFLAILLVIGGLAATGCGATFTVTKTVDTDDGICDADCSLREAVAAADSLSGDDEIVFQSGLDNPIVLSIGELSITSNLIITGTASAPTDIARSRTENTPDFRILYVSSIATVTLENLSLKNGVLRSEANSSDRNVYGGGIYNEGILFLVRSRVTENTLKASGLNSTANGAGIYNAGSLSLTSSKVDNNTAACINVNCGSGEYGIGGGIASLGALLIDASEIINNTAKGGIGQTEFGIARGGGIAILGGTAGLDKSTVDGNGTTARGAYGAGIDNNGSLTVTACAINNNHARGMNGGAVVAYGGGIYNTGSAAISNSTVSINDIYGNPDASEPVAPASGGGIYNAGTLRLRHATVAFNKSNYTSAAPTRGGGIHNHGTVYVGNTIIGSNQAASSEYEGTVVSENYNLIGRTAGSTGWTTTDLLNQPPQLGGIINFGGATRTVALLPNSPAINEATAARPPVTSGEPPASSEEPLTSEPSKRT